MYSCPVYPSAMCRSSRVVFDHILSERAPTHLAAKPGRRLLGQVGARLYRSPTLVEDHHAMQAGHEKQHEHGGHPCNQSDAQRERADEARAFAARVVAARSDICPGRSRGSETRDQTAECEQQDRHPASRELLPGHVILSKGTTGVRISTDTGSAAFLNASAFAGVPTGHP